MLCVKCNKNTDTSFFTETYPCKCGDVVVVSYNMCMECNAFWRSIDGVELNESLVTPEKESLVYPTGDPILDALSGFLHDKVQKYMEPSMEDCIYRCLNCNAIAYESTKGTFSCTLCGFEWSVLGGD